MRIGLSHVGAQYRHVRLHSYLVVKSLTLAPAKFTLKLRVLCLQDYHDPAVQTELAAFLVAMGKYSYYVCGSWENYPANMSTWNPVYDLPLGKPQGDALLDKDLVWRRTFSSGTSVSFDTKTNTGLVSWASRPRATAKGVKSGEVS